MEGTKLALVAGSDPELFVFVTVRDPAPKGHIMDTSAEMTEDQARKELRSAGLSESEIKGEIRKAREKPF